MDPTDHRRAKFGLLPCHAQPAGSATGRADHPVGIYGHAELVLSQATLSTDI